MSKQIQSRWLLVLFLFVATTLACASNTPVASIATDRPTRTPLPTFTMALLTPWRKSGLATTRKTNTG